jgi:hypothetical protein
MSAERDSAGDIPFPLAASEHCHLRHVLRGPNPDGSIAAAFALSSHNGSAPTFCFLEVAMHDKVRLIVFGSIAVITAGCADSLTPQPKMRVSSASASAMAAEERSQAAAGRTARGFEDEILRLEAKIPGVGGVFADSSGNFVIYVRDESKAAAAMSEFRAQVKTLSLPAEIRAVIDNPTRLISRVGAYDFSQLVAWSRIVLHTFGAEPGFVSIDADEAANRVRVTLSTEETRARVLLSVPGLGIPVGAVVADLGSRAQVSHNLRTTVRPLSGSYQIANAYGYCTLGWNVYLTGGIGKGFITAGHCSGNMPGSGSTGSAYYQATYAWQNKVGVESVNPPWNLADPDCAGITLCTIADVMFVKYDNDTWWQSRLAKTELPVGINNAMGSIEADWYLTPIYAVMDPYVGLVVDKVGRTTGWTRGSVNATCVTGTENGLFAGSIPFQERVLCADQFSNASAGQGDSGSPVFYKTATDGIFFVGVVYARTGTSYGPQSEGYRCTAGCIVKFTRYTRIKDHLIPGGGMTM